MRYQIYMHVYTCIYIFTYAYTYHVASVMSK